MTEKPKVAPCGKLVGLTIDKQWMVTERFHLDHGGENSPRTACYRAVNSEGKIVFVKAFDFRHDEIIGDTEKLEAMLAEFNNERRIHERCRDKNLSRVTRIITSGVIDDFEYPVQYLICEHAPKSLKEAHPPAVNQVSNYERLIALRKVASAIVQLHSAGIAHQDIKHSNVAYFDDKVVKLTDLGSASCRGLSSPPHDQQSLVGQPNLAPYEAL